MSRTLLNETVSALTSNGKNGSDVEWVGSKSGNLQITWEQFENMAKFEYDNGFGSQEVASDLVIVGSDWWLARGEYDGAESWDFHKKPIKKDTAASFDRVIDRQKRCYLSLDKMNRPQKTFVLNNGHTITIETRESNMFDIVEESVVKGCFAGKAMVATRWNNHAQNLNEECVYYKTFGFSRNLDINGVIINLVDHTIEASSFNAIETALSKITIDSCNEVELITINGGENYLAIIGTSEREVYRIIDHDLCENELKRSVILRFDYPEELPSETDELDCSESECKALALEDPNVIRRFQGTYSEVTFNLETMLFNGERYGLNKANIRIKAVMPSEQTSD